MTTYFHVRSGVQWASGKTELHRVAHLKRPLIKGTLCGIETRHPRHGFIRLVMVETGCLPVCHDCEAEAKKEA